jgi:hypothetical protein
MIIRGKEDQIASHAKKERFNTYFSLSYIHIIFNYCLGAIALIKMGYILALRNLKQILAVSWVF